MNTKSFVSLFIASLFLFSTASRVQAASYGDLNCDDAIDVVDVLLSINLALNVELSIELDPNENNIPDACEPYVTEVNCGANTVVNEAGDGCEIAPGVLEAAEADGFADGVASVESGGCDLTHAILKEAELSNADLSGANLTDVDLIFSNLSGINLSGANLHGSNLGATDLTNANLSGVSTLPGGMTLSHADLTGADLTGADLTGANVSDADLSGADLSGAILYFGTLTGAVWNNTICPDGTNSDETESGTCCDNLDTFFLSCL